MCSKWISLHTWIKCLKVQEVYCIIEQRIIFLCQIRSCDEVEVTDCYTGEVEFSLSGVGLLGLYGVAIVRDASLNQKVQEEA